MKNEANRKVEGVTNNLGHTIRENPLPIAVIGLGLGWLWLSERNKRDVYRVGNGGYRGDTYSYYDTSRDENFMEDARERVGDVATAVSRKTSRIKHNASEAVQDAASMVSDVAEQAGGAVGDATHRVGETISDAAAQMGESVTQAANRLGDTAEKVQERASDLSARTRQETERLRHETEWRSRMAVNRTRQSFWQNMEENPLMVGAVLAVAGAAVGAVIPASEYENKLLGETQRAVVTEVKDAAHRQNIAVADMIAEDEDSF